MKKSIFFAVIFFVLLTACSQVQEEDTSLEHINAVRTQAAETLEAMLTQSAGITPVPTHTPDLSLPTTTPTTTASPTQLPSTQSYCDRVAFVKDVSIPDGTLLSPGSSFIKTWRLKNQGTCAWTSAYALIFASGHHMSGPVSVTLPGTVYPGETIDISVSLTAPATEGHYTGYWMLRNASGVNFGYGDQANKAFYVDITSATQANLPESLLVWQDIDRSPCEKAIFSVEELAFGACTGELEILDAQQSAHVPRLLELVNTYSPFSTQTSAGSVTLKGTGSRNATWAEQRAIAEWAHLTYQIAEAGRGGAAWGLAFTWHREGGIGGLCDDVTVYLTGLTYISKCTGLNHQLYLNSSQLEQVYGWVDSFKSIDYSHTDPDISDPMTIRLALTGNGSSGATQTDIQSISNFASSLMASTPVSGGGYPPAALASQNALRAVLSAPSEVLIKRIEPVSWTDSCLGVPRNNEFCAQVITPGFRVFLVANGLLYEFHTDIDGEAIRLAGEPQPYHAPIPG
jgi:hypothetical protein